MAATDRGRGYIRLVASMGVKGATTAAKTSESEDFPYRKLFFYILSILSTCLVTFDSASGDCPYRSSVFLSTISRDLIIHFTNTIFTFQTGASV